MKLVKLILGSFVLAGTVALPTQIAAETTTNVEATTTNEEAMTTTNEEAATTTNNEEAATTTNNETTPDVPAAADQTISQNFPDPVVAARVAAALSTTVDAVVTDADLAGVTNLRIAEGAASLTGLEKLTGLKILTLFMTDITDIQLIGSLTSLENLSFYSNDNVTNYDIVSNLVSLKSLIINSYTATSIPALDELTALESLTISMELVQDYSTISTVPTLISLSVVNGGDNLSNIDFIKTLTGVKYLNLIGNSITDVTPLSGLTELLMLGLGHNKIESIAPLAALEKLTYLEAQFNYIQDVSPLANLADLTEVYMPVNTVEDISPLANVTTIDMTNQIIFYEGKLPGADIYVANEVRGLDGNLVAPALISDNGRYENGNLYFSGMTNASKPAYTFNVGDAPEIPLPDLSELASADEESFSQSYEQNFISSLEMKSTANETVAFSGIVAYFFTTEGTDIATPEGTTTPEGTLPNTGENTIEKSVLGGSAVILGAIALVLRRKF